MMIEGDNYGSYRHALAGVSDYDWSNLPPLTEQQKQEVAGIVDGFRSAQDVQAWVNANAGKADAAVLAAVVGAADQKKLIKVAASVGVTDMLAKMGIVTSDAGTGNREDTYITPLIAEADGYAATLIAAGVLKQADYDTQKATAKGAGWSVTSATAFRDAVKKALDNYVAGKDKGGMGWLLPVGIAAAAFFALRD